MWNTNLENTKYKTAEKLKENNVTVSDGKHKLRGDSRYVSNIYNVLNWQLPIVRGSQDLVAGICNTYI